MTLSPGIEQQVARAAIEAAGGPARREISDIADAADVKDYAVSRRITEQCIMKGWHQRRALPTRGDVAAAEVSDDGDAGQFGEQCGIVQLQGIAESWLMADGLAMTGERAYRRSRYGALLEDGAHGLRIDLRQLVGQNLGQVNLAPLFLVQVQGLPAQVVGVGQIGRGEYARDCAGKLDQSGVHTIEAGARHQTYDQAR